MASVSMKHAKFLADSGATIFPDEDHSDGEEREIIVGYSILDRVLLVSFTERSEDQVRIISSQSDTKRAERL